MAALIGRSRIGFETHTMGAAVSSVLSRLVRGVEAMSVVAMVSGSWALLIAFTMQLTLSRNVKLEVFSIPNCSDQNR